MAGENEKEEKERVLNLVLNSEACSSRPEHRAILRYLWENSARPVSRAEIQNEIKHVKKKTRVSDGAVRTAISELRNAVKNYFKDHYPPWSFKIPDAPGSGGYVIDWKNKLAYEASVARAFWHPHFAKKPNKQESRDINIVYNEYLFMHYWPELLVFRFYDVNAQAPYELDELEKKRKIAFDHYAKKKDGIKNLRPTTAYLTSGEVEARDAIVKWFSDNEATEVQPVIPSHASDKGLDSYWHNSLILLGSAAGNPLIEEVMKRQPELPIEAVMPSMEIDHRRHAVRIKGKLTQREENRLMDIDKDKNRYPIDLVKNGDDYELRFIPEKDWALVVVSRVPNHKTNDTALNPITILQCDYTRALWQVASVLTKDSELVERSPFNPLRGNYFQAIFLVPTRDSNKRKLTSSSEANLSDVELLVFRQLEVGSDNPVRISRNTALH